METGREVAISYTTSKDVAVQVAGAQQDPAAQYVHATFQHDAE
jgi:hypothetical protein